MGFWSSLFGTDEKQAAPTVIQQASKFPEELAPYIKHILGEAEGEYIKQKELGYKPYTGPTIAHLTPEEIYAQEGLAGLAGYAYQDTGKVDDAGEPITKLVRTGPGVTQPYLQEALDIYRTGAEKFTPEAAQEYMSPYQKAVTDIEKREAQKVFERDIMPRFEKQAVQAGGMSGLGSRAAIQAGQLGQAQMQQMGDIEAKGLQRAYMDAQRGFAEQKARERQLGQDVARTGPAMLQAGLAEQGILQDIGQQKREMAQGAMDEAYYKYLQEQSYPQDILSRYSGTVYGSPSPGPSYTQTRTGPATGPSTGQQLLGLGLTGLNIYGMGGGFKPGGQFSWGGAANKLFGGRSGGTIGGLSNLPVVYRQRGSTGASPGVTERVRRLIEQLNAAPEDERIELQEQLNIASLDPARKRGRAAEMYGAQVKAAQERLAAEKATTEALKRQKLSGIGKVLSAKESGTGATEKILQEAAKKRVGSRTGLKKKMEGVERMGPGIRGISKATGTRKSPVQSFLEIADTTFEGAKKFSGEEAARKEDLIKALSERERADLAKGTEEQVAISKERATAATEAVTSTAAAEGVALAENWKARKEELTTKQKAKLNRLIAENNLQDEIAGWPSKQQDKLLELLKKKWGIKKTQAEVRKLESEAIKNKALAKFPKGIELKAPVQKTIDRMVGLATGISSTLNKDGTLNYIKEDSPLTAPDAIQLAEDQAKFYGVYAKYRQRVKSDMEAISLAHKEIWGTPPPEPDEPGTGIPSYTPSPPSNIPGSSVPSFMQPRPKSGPP